VLCFRLDPPPPPPPIPLPYISSSGVKKWTEFFDGGILNILRGTSQEKFTDFLIKLGIEISGIKANFVLSLERTIRMIN
jgi:hypothetical protein